MKKTLSTLALLVGAALGNHAQAMEYSFELKGPGLGGSFTLTYGPEATDSKYPDAYEVTAIKGTIYDTNMGLDLRDVPILGLVPITHDAPEPTNLLAPNDFSRYAVATGLEHGVLSYDNLYWPKGSPQTATDYPPHGGFLDIYGLLVDIGGGKVVNVWSDGVGKSGLVDYGMAVLTHDKVLDYAFDTVAAVPEPSTYLMFGGGLIAMLAWRRRSAAKAGKALSQSSLPATS